MDLEVPFELTPMDIEVNIMERGMEAESRAKTAVCRSAGRIGRF